MWQIQVVSRRHRSFLPCLFSLALFLQTLGQVSSFGETLTPSQAEFHQLLRFAPDHVHRSKRPLQLAIDRFQAGQEEESLAMLREAVELTPALPPAELMYARMLLHGGRDSESLRRLDRLAVQTPDEPEVYASLGELALRQGRLTDAWLQLSRAESMVPPKTWDASRRNAFREELYQLKGRAAELRDDFTAADQVYEQWAEHSPMSASAVLGQARAKLLMGQTEDAVTFFRRARDLDPQTPTSEVLIALIYMNRRDNVLADEWFRKANQATRIEPSVRFDFARWLLTQDRTDEALAQLDAVPDDEMTDDVRLFLYGLVARFVGDLAQAERAFADLQNDHPADWQVADQLALVLVEQRDEAKRLRAAQLSEANLRQSPDRGAALATAGWVRLRLGDISTAESLLQQSLAAGAPTPATRYYVSRLLTAQGRKAESEKWLTEAIEQPGLWAERQSMKQTAAALLSK